MKKSGIILLCMAMGVTLTVMGQAPNRWHGRNAEENNESTESPRMGMQFSPEEYRARQQKFLTEKSGLTQEEADKFFPLYFELQQKKNEINANSRQSASNHADNTKLSDKEYEKLIDNLADAKIQIAKLEKEYLDKYKKIVPAGKILRIQIAETQFGSELLKEMQHTMRPMMMGGGFGMFPWYGGGSMMFPQSQFNLFPGQHQMNGGPQSWPQRPEGSFGKSGNDNREKTSSDKK